MCVSVLCVYYVCVCICVLSPLCMYYVCCIHCLCMCVCSCAPRLEVHVRCHPQLLPTLVSETGSFTELDAHRFDWSGWLASSRDPRVSASPMLRLLMLLQSPAFYLDAGDPDSDPHVCTSGTLLTEPLPTP